MLESHKQNVDKIKQDNTRTWLAFGITSISILGVVGLSLAIIITGNANITSKAQYVLNAVLPLFGTWVGTVLAYYFAKENFESASRSVERLTRQLSPQEKLQSTPVAAAMIPKSQMLFKDDNAAKLIEVLKELQNRGVKRLPIINKTGIVSSLIYREAIINYLYQINKALSQSERENLTIKDLLTQNPELQKPFAIVGEGETLADAKAAMERIVDCRDVFVTQSGNPNEVVVGLLTNVDIAKYSKA